MALKLSILSCLLLCGCLRAQQKIVVPGTGSKTAFIAENPTTGTNGSCYTARTTDPTTLALHDDGRLCGAFDATGYANARMTIQTVTGDSAFQNNTTWKALGMITGDTSGPSWFTAPDTFTDLVSPTNKAYAFIDGNTGAELTMREGNFSASNKVWAMQVGPQSGSSALFFRVYDDAHSASTQWLHVVRSGLTITEVLFPETVTTQILIPSANNTYTLGNSSASYSQLYAVVGNIGRPAASQGVFNIFNTTNSSAVTIAGTNAVTGIDVGIGNLFGSSSSMYPLNGNVDLGGTANRWRKIWVTDIDIGGVCTGCTAGANQALSNLTNPTAINQDLITNGTNIHVQDGSGHDLVELQNAGTIGNITVTDSSGNVKFLVNAFGVDVASGLSFNVGGSTGQTHNVVIGGCTMTFTGGVLTSSSGC